MKDYISLHNHTIFSLLDSTIRPKDLFARVAELGQSAVAITDHGTLSAAWDSYKFAKQNNVKLIMGCEFYFVDDLSNETDKLRHIILLARNHEGYKNLLLANKLANDNFIISAAKKVIPRIDWKILQDCSQGLICTTSCGQGILSKLINTRQSDKAFAQAQRLKDIFGEYLALEIQPHAMKRNAGAYNDFEDQDLVNRKLVEFGQKLDIKVIAATNAHYLTQDKWQAQDVISAIGLGMQVKSVARPKYNVHEFYVKSREEVESFFRRIYKEQAEVFCDNTIFFSELCEQPDWIDPKFTNPSGKELPEFPVQDQSDYNEFTSWKNTANDKIRALPDDKAYLRYWCEKGLYKKIPADKLEEYKTRLEEEFEVIEFHNFSSYFLIVADFVNFNQKNNLIYSAGRGSVGGSLVAYLVGIHEGDPIKYGLIFSRFLNKFKTSYPDIDCDISSHGKSIVQDYLIKKYGEGNVAHVSNISTMTPKVYARDIARTFEFGHDRAAAVAIGTAIADSIPDDIKTVASALKDAPLFAEYAKKYTQLAEFAEDLDGIPKVWSTHAGGIIISKRPIVEIVPNRRDKEGNFAIEYEKERAEENGLVKIDVLGLSTLDIMEQTVGLIRANGKQINVSDLHDYDREDEKAYKLMADGDTFGIFQMGATAGAAFCKKYWPKSIEDLALVTSLIRPNAKSFRNAFLNMRTSGETIELLHPNLSRALNGTYGFAVFEESLMFIAQDIAGWDLHEADNLRKLTKDKGKHPEKIAKWRDDFINSSVVKKGIDRNIAIEIWDGTIDSFQGYGFNKAHAVLYSLLTYQTAYLKAHYPLEFLTANLMHEVDSNAQNAEDNRIILKDQIRRLNVKIIPPNINESQLAYKIIDDNTLMTGLDALKFIGKNAIPEIITKRPFYSFSEFLSKIDGRKVTCAALQALAASGCLDGFGLTRKQMYLYAGDYKKKLQLWLKKGLPINDFKYLWPDNIGEWTMSEKYAMEIYYLGEGLCCGIKEAYPGFFDNRAMNFQEIEKKYPEVEYADDKIFLSADEGIIEGVVKNYYEFKVKKENSKIFGEMMGKMELQGPCGNSMSLTLFPSKLKHFKQRLKELSGNKVKLEPGIAVYCSGSMNWYEGGMSIVFDDLKRCMAIPAQPKDLEHKSVVMRMPTIRKKKAKTNEINKDELLDILEEDLVEQGLEEM